MLASDECPSSGHSVGQFLALHKRIFAVQV